MDSLKFGMGELSRTLRAAVEPSERIKFRIDSNIFFAGSCATVVLPAAYLADYILDFRSKDRLKICEVGLREERTLSTAALNG